MKLENDWRYQSLFNLKAMPVVHPDDVQTPLIKRIYELVNRPLSEYTIENLRLMIGQEIGLSFLIPLAMEKLNHDLFAEGDMYEGDLLSSVVNINPDFWRHNPELKAQLNDLVENRREEIDLREISLEKFYS
ncbi:contact-dependent growth inhibition system immunity protein [Mucilaginibacter aquaedulcis]|jgi:hypothetical protein|uniref:contact-dependent growth inhibition system immunity protein n=1 Tax=Mucilaginibacter aquaedulcis TaxID=1187081 RepID=UPI0025B4710D|nr:contact-dependent growth inhibition system immunity protein [Mucilaginibacter aquaedulcis]MDN3551749.1 contact-dependent growth inhibition system immunity protein [Mucilaginibacter aquaedulcis]